MKKAFLLGITLLATFSLTGCEMLEGILQGGQDLIDQKKEYKYDDFVVEIADDDFSFNYTKCKASIDKDGEKSEIEYTYDAESKQWYGEETKEKDGETTTTKYYETLDVVNFTKSCPLTAAFLDKQVDSVFKFYTTKNGYIITASYKDSNQQAEAEYNFNKEGLMTSLSEKNTDLKSVEAKTRKISYSYSK